MDVILATGNPSKVLQIQEMFKGSDITVRTQTEVGVEGSADETGETLEENARRKVQHAHAQISDAWIMADDTGIFIQALDGEPGVDAAYWGGEDLTVEERMWYCIKRMFPYRNRSATFRTVVVILDPQGQEHVFVGEVLGSLAYAPQAKPQPNMPYSALFRPEGQAKSFAEMTVEEENAISHRGKAFRQVREFLKTVA